MKSRKSSLFPSLFRPTALAVALAALLTAPAAQALNSVPVAVSEAYFGAASPDKLAGISFLSAAGGIVGLNSVSYQFDTDLSSYRVAQVGNSLQLAAVPEPETWAMLLAGLGLLAGRARRNAEIRQAAGV